MKLPLILALALTPTTTYAQTNVYRFYNPVSGEHLFSTSQTEVSAPAFAYEGVAFAVFPTQLPYTTALYRCRAGIRHFITTSTTCEGAPGSVLETTYGFAYIPSYPAPGTLPLYRLFYPANGDHLYTVSSGEVSGAQSIGYHYEGTPAYVAQPTYYPPTPYPPGPVSVGPSPWSIRYSPGMPATTSADYQAGQVLGGQQFNFPAGGSCPSSIPPTNYLDPCHQVDYVTTTPYFPVTLGQTIFISFTIARSAGATLLNDTETNCNGNGVIEIFPFFERSGDQALTNVGYRWWAIQPMAILENAGPPTATRQTFSGYITMNFSNFGCVQGICTAAQFADTLANLGAFGFTFGGGCAKGHGVYLDNTPGISAWFSVTNFEPQ